MTVSDDIIAKAYLGKRLHDLLSTLSDQLAIVYQTDGIVVPVASSSTLYHLSQTDGATAADIARALQITHQLATQRIEKLSQRGLVEKRPDEDDARKVCWVLTSIGRDQAKRLRVCMENVVDVHDQLFDEIGVNLISALDDAQSALSTKPLADRFAELSDVSLAS